MAALKTYKEVKAWGPQTEELEFIYDFSKDAGATGALDIFTAKEGLIIKKAYLVVETTCTSGGSATVSVGKSGDAAGVVGSTAVASLSAGAGVAGVTNLAYALAADDVVKMTIGTAALTAGKIRIRLDVCGQA